MRRAIRFVVALHRWIAASRRPGPHGSSADWARYELIGAFFGLFHRY